MKYIKYFLLSFIFCYSLFALTSEEKSLFDAINRKDAREISSILTNSKDIDVNVMDAEGYTPIHRAVYNNNLDIVNELLKSASLNINSKLDMKVVINGWYLGGASPLILASYLGYSDIADALLKNNADIKSKDNVDGAMAIHMASANGNDEVIKILLAKDETLINEIDNKQNTPLHWAAMKDKPETVKLLVENGADIEAKDMDGWTPLHYAAAFSSVQTVQNLVELGADKESKAKDGKLPLDYAQDEEVKNYLSSGYMAGNIEREINSSDDTDDTENGENSEETTETAEDTDILSMENETAQSDNELEVGQMELLLAVKNNDIISIRSLIRDGVNPNFKDEEGFSPLHRAVENNSLDCVNALLSYGDIDKEITFSYGVSSDDWNLDGATPLLFASFLGYDEIVGVLVESNCNMRARDVADGAMPIHVASANGRDEVVRLLLSKDETLINETDTYGEITPLHWAAMKDKASTVRLLLDFGANPNIKGKGNSEKTPLHYAAMFAGAETVRAIVEKDKTSITILDGDGLYPIHVAALGNNAEAVTALVLNGGADVNLLEPDYDYTALMYAAESGNMESVVALVEKCNADKTLKNSDGYTAAELAYDSDYKNIASYLGYRSGGVYSTDNAYTDNELPVYNRKTDLSKKWWN